MTRRAFKDLSFNQRISLALAASAVMVAFASLIVSILSLATARDTSEMKTAIAGLAEVAKQAGRQADAANSQLSEIKSQTGSLAIQAKSAQGQLDNAKAQTKAISAQTDAIKNTSVASIKAADAQAMTAKVTERASTPHISLNHLSLDSIGPDPKLAPYDTATLNIEFGNTGGGAFTQKWSSIGLLIDDHLPPNPGEKGLMRWGGNDFSVGPGKNLTFSQAPKFGISPDAVEKLKTDKLHAYVVGVLNYQDTLGRDHAFCFAYQLHWREGVMTDAFPVHDPRYKCADPTA